MATTVALKPIQPAETIVPPLVTVNDHINNREIGEYIAPLSSYSYSSAGSRRFGIKINSPTDFVDFSRSALRFKLTVSEISTAGVTRAPNDIDNDMTKFLCEGGAHSLFSKITIGTVSNTILQEVPNYNRFYAGYASMNYSKDYIDNVLNRCGDSVGKRVIWEEILEELAVYPAGAAYGQTTTFSKAVWSLDAGAGAVIGVGLQDYDYSYGAADTHYCSILHVQDIGNTQIGDFVEAYIGAPGNYLPPQVPFDNAQPGYGIAVGGVVIGIARSGLNDYTIYFRPLSPLYGEAIANVAVYRVVLRHRVRVEPARWLAANTTEYEIIMQPFVPLLKDPRWFCLPFIRGGIEITFVMEDPTLCIKFGSPSNINAAGVAVDATRPRLDYTIANPTYVVDMIRLDESMMQYYNDLYNNGGIHYHFLDIWSTILQTESGAIGNYNFLLQPQRRSARYVYMQIKHNYHDGETCDNYRFTDSMAAATISGLQTLQLAVGSARFPLAQPYEVTNGTLSSITPQSLASFKYFNELSLGSIGLDNSSRRFHVKQGMRPYSNSMPDIHDSSYWAMDPNRCPLFIDISRDSSPFAGSNLMYVPITGNIVWKYAAKVQQWDNDLLSANLTATDGTTVLRNIWTWVVSDAILSIAADAVVVRA